MAQVGTIGQKTYDADLRSLVRFADDVFGIKVWVDETLGGDWGEHYLVKQGMHEIAICQTNDELYGILMDATNGQ